MIAHNDKANIYVQIAPGIIYTSVLLVKHQKNILGSTQSVGFALFNLLYSEFVVGSFELVLLVRPHSCTYAVVMLTRLSNM